MSDVISELFDLELNTSYLVTSYIKCRGSCGIYYFINVEPVHSSGKKLVIVRPDNNVYDYLQSKTNNNKFPIKRMQSHINESYMFVDGVGGWIELILFYLKLCNINAKGSKKPSAFNIAVAKRIN